MPSPEPFLIFTRKLNELAIPYMVSGSVAAIYYGEPRLTNDVDIIVYLKREDISSITRAFPIEEFYYPPPNVIQLELARLAHAQTADLDGEKVVFAPPEYVIVRKLQFFREGQSPKHLRDIDRMLIGLGGNWNRESLNQMIQQQGLSAEWQQVLAQKD